MNAVQFSRYENRVEASSQYKVHNPSDSSSHKSQSEGGNYIAICAKKVKFYRHNKYQNVKEFVLNQVETAWKEGKCFIY